jgi:hypothetical protein
MSQTISKLTLMATKVKDNDNHFKEWIKEEYEILPKFKSIEKQDKFMKSMKEEYVKANIKHLEAKAEKLRQQGKNLYKLKKYMKQAKETQPTKISGVVPYKKQVENKEKTFVRRSVRNIFKNVIIHDKKEQEATKMQGVFKKHLYNTVYDFNIDVEHALLKTVEHCKISFNQNIKFHAFETIFKGELEEKD